MKRRALQIFVLLLLGAIVNVAVAWGFVLNIVDIVVPGSEFREPRHADHLQWNSLGRPGFCSKPFLVFEHRFCGWSRLAYWGGIDPETIVIDAVKLTAIVDGVSFSSLVKSREDEMDFMLETRAGWPTSALCGVRNYPRQLKTKMGNGLMQWLVFSPLPWSMPNASENRVPVRPIWPGFAINTIFYAAVLWMVFAMPFALRRRRRIKRGLCPACAYPVGTSPVCTECGTVHDGSIK